MSNIRLIGFMGTGKSAVGKVLAAKLGMDFEDVDAWIVDQEGMSIAKIFELYGEQRFRQIEHQALKALCAKPNTVLATGGGAVLRPENCELLSQEAWIVWLKARPEVILKRCSNKKFSRPLLNVPEPLQVIEDLLEQRAEAYDFADFNIDGSEMSIDQIVETIAREYDSRRA